MNSRRAVLTAATASVAVLAGVLPGTPSAASGPDGAVELAYRCAFHAGGGSDGASAAPVAEDATVTVQQTYPATGAVGATLRPGRLTVEVELDKDAATAVLPAGTASVSATGALTARVTQGPSTADATWPGLRAAATPATDGLDLTFTGEATALSVTAAGTVRFDAGRLDLSLYAEAAPTVPPSAGSATPTPTDPAGTDAAGGDAVGTDDAQTDSSAADAGSDAAPDPGATGVDLDPTGVTAACTPKDGQAVELGEVDVAGPGTPTPSGSGTATPSAAAGSPAGTPAGTAAGRNGTITLAEPPHSGVTDCPPAPTGEADQAVLDAFSRPATANHNVIAPADRLPECTFLTGLSNVGKLKGAATINDLNDHPAITRVTQVGTWVAFVDGKIYLELDSIVRMDLPPSHSTFLTFGFMPTTADMTMTQVGPMTLIIAGSSGVYTTYTYVWGKLDLRLTNIKVNGTPLDVGPNCHTVTPLDIKLTGIDLSNQTGNGTPQPSDYNEIAGGPLSQEHLTIPPFTGCSAHGENVDALLTSSISGPDNSLNFIQGPLCIPISEVNCKSDQELAYPSPPHR